MWVIRERQAMKEQTAEVNDAQDCVWQILKTIDDAIGGRETISTILAYNLLRSLLTIGDVIWDLVRNTLNPTPPLPPQPQQSRS